MELVEYAQAVDHSRMPLLLRVLNALGRYAFLADIPLMAYAYCLVMARNGCLYTPPTPAAKKEGENLGVARSL